MSKNPLEALKLKLMVKPTIKEREPVAVIIKGKQQPKRTVIFKNIFEDNNDLEEGEEIDIEQVNVKEINKDEKVKEAPQNIKQTIPLIVDETHKGIKFDRATIMNNLTQHRLAKTIKPMIVEPEPLKETVTLIEPVKKIKKPRKIAKLIIRGDEEDGIIPEIPKEKQEQIQEQIVEDPKIIEDTKIIEDPKIIEEKEGRITIKPKKLKEKPQKGIAKLGAETIVAIGDTDLTKRLPKPKEPIIIKVSSYYMNNREIFVNFINSIFEPYRLELQENKENISCKDIGKTNKDFSLLTHQKIVRDYLNLFTPYRGLLLYHGLGSGKTCTSIAIAEGMKNSKRVIIMLPASLRANYIKQLKECGDLLYKKEQFWEWISTDTNPEVAEPMSAILNLPLEYIRRHRGAWFVNIKKKSNYKSLSDVERKSLDSQLNEMINQKYSFINYNGLRSQRLSEMTAGFTKNLFDDSVVIIDEAHNLISRIVNKIKKEKNIQENKRGLKDTLPTNLSLKLYELLLSAKNAKVILLSGTPVINYPNEFGILFNILRGYIKTWNIPLDVQTSAKTDKKTLQDMLLGEKSLDYLDYSPSSGMLTITRNPFGFKNKIKVESGYQGVSNVSKNAKGENTLEGDFISDDDFEKKIIGILIKNQIKVIMSNIEIKNKKALPDTLDLFESQYIDSSTKLIKNSDALKRRIIGLTSYFKSAQENLLPKYNKEKDVDYHIIEIPMSNFQFKIYESARIEERKMEKQKRKPSMSDDLYKEPSSTYRIFSRLYCNFVMEDRPLPIILTKKADEEKEEQGKEEQGKEEHEEAEEQGKEKQGQKKKELSNVEYLLKKAREEETKQDVDNEREGEVEGDEILDKIGGISYKERLDNALKYIKDNSNEFLTIEKLETYSPKYLQMLKNITNPRYMGLHLVYSQFRTMEGIGIFTLVLDKNGFTQFKIKKNSLNVWEIDIDEANKGKPTYALYTGTETSEEKEIIRLIYNGEWEQVPESISKELKKIAHNNNMGEIIKVLMITSSGSEGINLRNTRYVHIMEPYWHPVRLEQVIGRARRICSHENLPKPLQTVEVFVYLMKFSVEQLASDISVELKRKDLSKALPKKPITSDQYLYEISEIKSNLTAQLTDAIKESAFDCYIYSNGKCLNFGDPTNSKFSYVPDYSNQENDTTVQANKVAIEWTGKPITIDGKEYVYRRINNALLYIYDKASYIEATTNPRIIPLQIGTVEIKDGKEVFKLIT